MKKKKTTIILYATIHSDPFISAKGMVYYRGTPKVSLTLSVRFTIPLMYDTSFASLEAAS